jgi:hypothetical protein
MGIAEVPCTQLPKSFLRKIQAYSDLSLASNLLYTQAGLKYEILLLQPPQYWRYRPKPPGPANCLLYADEMTSVGWG